MFFRSVSLILICSGISLAVIGCGGAQRPPGMPKLYHATVSVVQDGKPLAEAIVSLVPRDAGNQWSSGGVTDSKGQLTLTTYGQFPGVPAGQYKVCITKQERVGELDFSNPASPKGNQELFEVVDPIFKSEATTTQEMEVSSKGKNHFIFDVGKPVKIKAAVPGV